MDTRDSAGQKNIKQKLSESDPQNEGESIITGIEKSPPRHSTSTWRIKKLQTDRDGIHTRELTRSKTRISPPLRNWHHYSITTKLHSDGHTQNCHIKHQWPGKQDPYRNAGVLHKSEWNRSTYGARSYWDTTHEYNPLSHTLQHSCGSKRNGLYCTGHD
jgi:hypothetical protein